MKSFKDYLSNALDDLTFWNDSNTRQAVTNQYVKDTILRNVPVKVTLRDQEDKIVDDRDVKCSFQYLFNPMRNCKCAFYIPIGTDKVIGTSAEQSFLVLTTFDVNNAARESEIWDNFKRATYGCKASIDGGDLVLKFTKPVRLVGVDQPVTVELVIDKRVGSWIEKIDPMIYDLQFSSTTTGSDVRKFAEKHKITKPAKNPKLDEFYTRRLQGVLTVDQLI